MQDEALYILIKQIVEDMGYIALETLLLRAKNKYTLKVVIYHAGRPVGADDCTDVAEVLSRRLDIDDPIEKRYDLLVESPGVDREIKQISEYPYFIGKEFKIFPVSTEGLKEGFFIGILESCQKDTCVFSCEKEQRTIAFTEIRKARLYYDFQKALKKQKQ